MGAFQIVSGNALAELFTSRVYPKLVQEILHVNGKGVDESYVEQRLGAASISIPRVSLGAGSFRTLGATVNGGQFNANDPVVSTSDFIEIPLLFVYDRTEEMSKIINDKAGYDYLQAKIDNITKKIARGINALTLSVQISRALNDAYDDNTVITNYIPGTNKPLDIVIDVNGKLDEGDEAIGVDYFPSENRQGLCRPSFINAMKKRDGGLILNSELGQQMLATGYLNPWTNSEASKVELRNGYSGEVDGVPMYKVSSVLWKLAEQYTLLGDNPVASGAFDNIEGMICSSWGTLRGFSAAENIEVIPSQKGQGWTIQPLVHGGCVCISGKSVGLIVNDDFVNGATATAKYSTLPPESQPTE